MRQLRQKAELNLKVILVGDGVHLHLNVFDLPQQRGLCFVVRQFGSNYAQLQVSVLPFLLILVSPMRDKSVSFATGKL